MNFIPPLFAHQYILGQLIKRDVLLRYRGAIFGVVWVFLNPLLMLTIYAFVFGHVFSTRWPEQHNGAPFWLVLFSGLIAFNVFSEAVSRAPTSVRAHPNFVKKIVFPVEVLPLVPLGSALVHAAFNLVILLSAVTWTGHLSISFALYPLMLIPIALLALGLSWFLAAWGVFIKDMGQIVPPFVQVIMFLSPVFYPASAVPQAIQPLYRLNPLGAVIEACQAAALGQPVPWLAWGIALCIGAISAALGGAFFRKSRQEFADVL